MRRDPDSGIRMNCFIALNIDGVLAFHVSSMNGDREVFECFMKDYVLPHMEVLGEKNSIAFLDNARIHESTLVVNSISAKGANVLWNTAYCFWHAPVEQSIHQIKNYLRQNEALYTVPPLAGSKEKATHYRGNVECNITHDAYAYFKHAGHAP